MYKEKPKPEIVYDSVEVSEYLQSKYKFRDYILGDYIRDNFSYFANGTQHSIREEFLTDAYEMKDEYRKLVETLLDEFGTKGTFGREVKIHYWW